MSDALIIQGKVVPKTGGGGGTTTVTGKDKTVDVLKEGTNFDLSIKKILDAFQKGFEEELAKKLNLDFRNGKSTFKHGVVQTDQNGDSYVGELTDLYQYGYDLHTISLPLFTQPSTGATAAIATERLCYLDTSTIAAPRFRGRSIIGGTMYNAGGFTTGQVFQSTNWVPIITAVLKDIYKKETVLFNSIAITDFTLTPEWVSETPITPEQTADFQYRLTSDTNTFSFGGVAHHNKSGESSGLSMRFRLTYAYDATVE